MKSNQLTGRIVIPLNFQQKAITVNFPTTQELFCCLYLEKVSNRVILEKVKDTVNSQLWDQQGGFSETDLAQIREPPSKLLWNSPSSGFLSVYHLC